MCIRDRTEDPRPVAADTADHGADHLPLHHGYQGRFGGEDGGDNFRYPKERPRAVDGDFFPEVDCLIEVAILEVADLSDGWHEGPLGLLRRPAGSLPLGTAKSKGGEPEHRSSTLRRSPRLR